MTPISIHALLAESDQRRFCSRLHVVDFYPRSPCGERLPTGGQTFEINLISIHALLAESDGRRPGGPFRLMLFLSTLSLRRATAQQRKHAFERLVFLSTLSLRRATTGFDSGTFVPAEKFLSTLSLRRATPQIKMMGAPVDNFYPRSPCGERPGR